MKLLPRFCVFFALAFAASGSVVAQPAIQWQRCFGGSQQDIFTYVIQTSDGGCLLAGSTFSSDYDGVGNHGNQDFFVVKVNSFDFAEWRVCLGSSKNEIAFSAAQTSDGGYILCGRASSNDGEVTRYHGGVFNDLWVVKLTPTGTIQWEECLGGTRDDGATSVFQTSGGGFIVCGYTNSDDGDVSGNHGALDVWAVRLDPTGSIQWQKCFGGSNAECAFDMVQTTDSGFILVGYTYSNNGNASGKHGGMDGWVVKIDPNGVIQWQKCLGGSGDDLARSIVQTSDGGYIIAGQTTSNDGDVKGNHGRNDVWVVKMDATGSIQWQKCLGGSGDDTPSSIIQTTDGGFMVAGLTTSNDGDVCGNHGGVNAADIVLDTYIPVNLGLSGNGPQDGWVVKLDSHGSIVGQKCIGGSKTDWLWDGNQTPDGGYMLAGSSASNDGDVSGNHGDQDGWVVKLGRFPEVSTRDFSTDTVGGLVYVPIIAYSDPISKGLNFVLTYDTSHLIYQGSVSHSGAQLNSAGSWPGHAVVRLDSAALSDDTLAGYAIFAVSSHYADSTTLVVFDSLPKSNPCASTQSVVASRVTLPHGCGIAMLTNFMLNKPLIVTKISRNPVSQSTQITFTPEPAGHAEISILNLLGTEVAHLFSGELGASGEHTVQWNPNPALPNGMYGCLIRMNGRVERLPMMLVR